MGRVKLKIKRLENTNGRQATYAKRRQGIMKKANELSILCDIDIVLLMFSPTGKPSLCRGKRSSVEEVIGKFSQLTPQERTKRKLESLEALKKTFRKLDHDVNIPEFLGTSNPNIEELSNQAKFLQSKLSEMQKRISCWTEIDRINNIEHLGQMENSLRESLNQIRMRKESIQKQQFISFECSSPFNDLQIPFRMCSGQQLQSFPWTHNNDNPRIVSAEDSKLLVNRDVECSASSSYGSYTSYIGTGKSPEISTAAQDNGFLNELNQNAPLRLQLGGQFPYLPYNLNFLNDTKIQPAAEMSQQENPLNYHVAGSFEAHRAGCSNNYHSWAPNPAHCTIPIFDEHLYAQIPD